ncbi:MAG: type I-E CRISPR-associated protein Cas5/CasD [Proteobacteria bacterium]|nr:type I-E CRISPR-associated protein Cas5/CasD [Pseudomonadota bacterium]MBU1688291.1 type I-E CRISPR-associated protein Cas5/CasD [Pseudomonadota bacterium]
MQTFLILKLQGGMQSWGTHSFEDYRPSAVFPTRSGIVGLLGACLGIERDDVEARSKLNASFNLTVRADKSSINMQRITDYHTVLDARKVDGSARKDAILSSREYLCDACFTVVLSFCENSPYTQEEIVQALAKPSYTPVLGRRSCPLHRPLFEMVLEAENVQEVLEMISPGKGIIYSETRLPGSAPLRMRDVPMPTPVRQFATRDVYILGEEDYYAVP